MSAETRLTVALDARWLQQRPLGGVGRALSPLVPLLAREVSLELLTEASWSPLTTSLPVHALHGPGGWATTWLQLAAPRWLRHFDGLFHCPFYGLPYMQPVPMVVTIHDVTFEEHPEWFPPGRRVVFRAQARHAARTARRILTVSEHVRRAIVERYGVEPSRIGIAPNTADPIFSPAIDPAEDMGIVSRLAVTRPYVVALGGSPRRNLGVAVDAWRSVRRAGADVDLVVVGREGIPPERGLVQVGPVEDRIWAALLRQAVVFCYPTRYEGFGLPALEAIACGTPVVCAPVGALPEVLGDVAQWAEKATTAAIASALTSIVSDPARQQFLRRAGPERVKQLPGSKYAAAVIVDMYRQALDG